VLSVITVDIAGVDNDDCEASRRGTEWSMTILVDWQIRDYIRKGAIGVDPFNENYIQPNSLDVTLLGEFTRYAPTVDTYDHLVDPYINMETIHKTTNKLTLITSQLTLASTQETISLPDNIVACIEGKSSLARLGLQIHQTGGWIDAGFSGQVTLELYNVSNRPIVLTAGMPIAQIVFFETEHCEVPYGMKKDAKYQGQTGPTPSRYHLNKRE
jgi:dCTP deaminase